ncbi:TOBE domain-containing protein [Nesterenkonia sp. LB17]|uniref:TOBE domain-containing protein n=1 Tax=unclassified Nesterenkonia TaxID=2629769 RepID=UPI001F4C769F|nr:MULTISPECIES: TOBE domain-containing protein [unclassified Nesterenkonia]MCH8560037.1 TOBE domain-containing protein [Nesterenkonia sp. DZ6]MCH8562217.1 TOBE domain-containing protein [Nesterenkonia sp. YGD6]MCH8564250.1 TOBE domain-containing protein [Nesterenkonia sp. LB17]MCH8569879.1 TOBE domain-containing protein [Nesterenkonia sp. AY15]
MTQLRVSQVARLLGVSSDTVRRLISAGTLSGAPDAAGRTAVSGESVAAYARSRSEPGSDGSRVSARNRLEGIVTEVKTDGVMAQVEVAAGAFRLTSLMTRDAAEEMRLAPGVPATVVVKATNAVVELGEIIDER